MVSGVPTENLLSAILEALAEPTVSYIGLGYDSTVPLTTGQCVSASQSMIYCPSYHWSVRPLSLPPSQSLLFYALHHPQSEMTLM